MTRQPEREAAPFEGAGQESCQRLALVVRKVRARAPHDGITTYGGVLAIDLHATSEEGLNSCFA